MSPQPEDRPKLGFAIVGQPKSGTTALAHFLAEHPAIAMSVPKESAFFATDFHRESDEFHGRPLYFSYRTDDDFAKLFAHARSDQLLGEGSTSSLYSTEAAANLHGHNPAMKIIMIFRDPVEMVPALHIQYVNETVEDLVDLSEALSAEDDRAAGQRLPPRVRAPSYVLYGHRARYTEQLRRFQKFFPDDQILMLFHSEFRADNAGEYARVLRFLGVDETFQPEFATVHGGQAPRSHWINRLLNRPGPKRWLQRMLGPGRYTSLRNRIAGWVLRDQPRSAASAETVETLRRRFRPEVQAFGEHIGRDLLTEWHYLD